MRKQWVVRTVILVAAFGAGTAVAFYKMLVFGRSLAAFGPNVGMADTFVYAVSFLGGVAGLILAAGLMAIFHLARTKLLTKKAEVT